MRKKAILAFMLAAALLMTGCALVEKDVVVDNATVIIQVGDEAVTKERVNSTFEEELYYTAIDQMSRGLSLDTSDPQVRSIVLDQTINGFVQQLVLKQKAHELGFDTFTAEEDAAIRETAQTNMDSDKERVKASYFADTKLEGEELEAAVLEKMTEAGATFDLYYESAKASAAQKKLRDSAVSGVTVSDEEIKTEYDTRVANAKTTYETNPSAYGSDVNRNSTVYYAPAGYRYVKHILRAFPEETRTALADLQTKINEKATQISTVDSSIAALGEDVKQDDPSRTGLADQKASLEQEKADLQSQYNRALASAYVALQPSVDEVLKKLAAKEDFDALMETYGEDPGMKNSPQKENGYAICKDFASFDPAFTQAAMALKSVGDVSTAVRGVSGIHIIQYASDIPEGAVALDSVKEDISSALLSSKQDEAYYTQVDQWVEQANVQIYKDRLN